MARTRAAARAARDSDAPHLAATPLAADRAAAPLATTPSHLAATTPPTAVELFAGMGGMALGLARAGVAHACLVECDARCVETLRANGVAGVVHARVEDVDFTAYRGASLVCGGVPCTPFSPAGKRLGEADPRNLWEEALRAVREVGPAGFLFENSVAMAWGRTAPYLARIVARLEAMGFRVSTHLVDAADYGAPQRRRRLLLVGTHPGRAAAPFAAPPPTTPVPATVREALASLGPPTGEGEHALIRSEARAYKSHQPSELDRPGRAVVGGGGGHGCGGGNNCVRLDDGRLRYFTIREMARLQTFPDAYRLPAVWTRAVCQIGNAAPPALIHPFAERLVAALA